MTKREFNFDLKSMNTSITTTAAEPVTIKSRGFLTHSNSNLLKFLEISFLKFTNSPTVLEKAYEDFFEKNNINFPRTDYQTNNMTNSCTLYNDKQF